MSLHRQASRSRGRTHSTLRWDSSVPKLEKRVLSVAPQVWGQAKAQSPVSCLLSPAPRLPREAEPSDHWGLPWGAGHVPSWLEHLGLPAAAPLSWRGESWSRGQPLALADEGLSQQQGAGPAQGICSRPGRC